MKNMNTKELYGILNKMIIPDCKKVADTINNLFTLDMNGGNHDIMARFLLFYNLGRLDGIRQERARRKAKAQ